MNLHHLYIFIEEDLIEIRKLQKKTFNMLTY